MQTPRNWVGLAVFAAFTGAFIACSDFTPPLAGGASVLTVSPRSAHLNVGGTLQLNANGSSGRVTWSSSDDTVATVSFGKVTALASGTATIRAVSGTSHAISTISVTRAASIALSSGNVSFNAVPSGPIPDSQMVDVADGGEDPLTGLQIAGVTYGSGATGWLTATLTQTDAPSSLVLRPNTSSLAPGSYTATVSIAAASPSTPSQSVTVTFTLIRPGVIAGGIFAFIVSFDQLPISLFLVVPNGETLPVVLLNYIRYDLDGAIAAAAMVSIVLALTAVLLLERIIGLRAYVRL